MNRMAAHRMMLFGTASRPATAVAQHTRPRRTLDGVAVEDPCPPGDFQLQIAWKDRDTYNRYAGSFGRELIPEPVEAPAEEVAA